MTVGPTTSAPSDFSTFDRRNVRWRAYPGAYLYGQRAHLDFCVVQALVGTRRGPAVDEYVSRHGATLLPLQGVWHCRTSITPVPHDPGSGGVWRTDGGPGPRLSENAGAREYRPRRLAGRQRPPSVTRGADTPQTRSTPCKRPLSPFAATTRLSEVARIQTPHDSRATSWCGRVALGSPACSQIGSRTRA
jgi:hypothetical protein